MDQLERVHRAVSSGDMKMLSFLVNNAYNAVCKLVEGEDYKPMVRTTINGGDAISKVQILREMSDHLGEIADMIELDEETGNDNGRASGGSG